LTEVEEEKGSNDPEHQSPENSSSVLNGNEHPNPTENGGKRKYGSGSDSENEVESKRFANSASLEENENKLEYSNPMASDLEGENVDEEAFRGDRIGNSTYAERHVLKILMRWIKVS
jgi:hypothetical protein